jgi:hypothetical protein
VTLDLKNFERDNKFTICSRRSQQKLGAYFTNILNAQKRQSRNQCHFLLLGPTRVKAACKMLMKLTRGASKVRDRDQVDQKDIIRILHTNLCCDDGDTLEAPDFAAFGLTGFKVGCGISSIRSPHDLQVELSRVSTSSLLLKN